MIPCRQDSIEVHLEPGVLDPDGEGAATPKVERTKTVIEAVCKIVIQPVEKG